MFVLNVFGLIYEHLEHLRSCVEPAEEWPRTSVQRSWLVFGITSSRFGQCLNEEEAAVRSLCSLWHHGFVFLPSDETVTHKHAKKIRRKFGRKFKTKKGGRLRLDAALQCNFELQTTGACVRTHRGNCARLNKETKCLSRRCGTSVPWINLPGCFMTSRGEMCALHE